MSTMNIIVGLRKYDIYARKYFYPALNEMTCYKDIYDNQSMRPD